MIRHLLLDLDGTLIDSDQLHDRAYRDCLARFAPAALEGFDYSSVAGMKTVKVMSRWLSGQELERAVACKQESYRERVRSGELQLMPGARELLEFAAAHSLESYLVTGSSRASVALALDSLGISSFFRGLVTGCDVRRGKPEPEAYLVCLEKFGLERDVCLAVEDSANGLQAARAAGLRVLLVNPSEGGAEPRFQGLAEVVRWLSESRSQNEERGVMN